MTLFDWYHRNIPEYYDGMYLDGYKPHEILEAAHKSIMRRYYERKAAYEAAKAENDIMELKITSEVKVK